MAKKTANDQKIAREEQDLGNLLTALPDNPIPWVSVLKLVAPILARLAVRYALKASDRSLGEGKVNSVSDTAGQLISTILAKRLPNG